MAKKANPAEAAPGASVNSGGTTVNVTAAPAAAVKKASRPRWSYVSFISKWRSFSWSLVKVAIAILILVIAWFVWKIGNRVYVMLDRNSGSPSHVVNVVSEPPAVPQDVQAEEDLAVAKVRRENAEIIARLETALSASVAESAKTREALEKAQKEFGQLVLKHEAPAPHPEQMIVTRIEPVTVTREVRAGPRLVSVKGSWQTFELGAGERSRRFCVEKEVSQGKVSIVTRTPGLKAELDMGGGLIPRFMGRNQRVTVAIPPDQDEIEIPPDAKGVWFYWEAEEGKPTDGKPLVIKVRE